MGFNVGRHPVHISRTVSVEKEKHEVIQTCSAGGRECGMVQTLIGSCNSMCFVPSMHFVSLSSIMLEPLSWNSRKYDQWSWSTCSANAHQIRIFHRQRNMPAVWVDYWIATCLCIPWTLQAFQRCKLLCNLISGRLTNVPAVILLDECVYINVVNCFRCICF